MNFIDAVKSGRPIRRRGHCYWSRKVGENTYVRIFSKEWVTAEDLLHNIRPSVGDVLADDWEVQEREVLITKSKFWEAFKQGLKAEGERLHSWSTRGGYSFDAQSFIMNEMAKALGLE